MTGPGSDDPPMGSDDALLELLGYLKERGYRFQVPTPATHARVLARGAAERPTLRDVFGWNRSVAETGLDAGLLALMAQAQIVQAGPNGVKSALRVASLGEDLFLHSSYPTDEPDAVFFGPDTYRFVRFVQARWPAAVAPLVVDMGTGSGAGGIAAARLAPKAAVTLVDVNAQALRLARLNAGAANVAVVLEQSSVLPTGADVVIANPPYMMDASRRAYRHGGGLFGGEVALQWARDALTRLAPGGTLLLYTGAAIVDGTAPLLVTLRGACSEAGATLDVEEIDPDVFGEELERDAYANVERIAAIGAVVRAAAR